MDLGGCMFTDNIKIYIDDTLEYMITNADSNFVNLAYN